VPTDLLLQTSKVRLDFGRDVELRRGVAEDDIDDAANRLHDRHLELGPPPRMQRAEERLDHRGLKPIVDSRA
jgi:hypothetical protein